MLQVTLQPPFCIETGVKYGVTKIRRKLLFTVLFLLCIYCCGCSRFEGDATLQMASTVDVTNLLYETDLVEICFAGNPQEWHLDSVTCYDGNGQFQSRVQYTLDENHVLWKEQDGGKQFYADTYDSDEIWKVHEIGVTTPEYDGNGMLIRQISRREDTTPDDDTLYVEEIGESYSYSMILDEYRLTSCVSWIASRYENENTLSLMEITALDSVGSGTSFQVWGAYYVEFDGNGYPQLFAQKHDSSYSVIKPDEYGRPLWIGWYDAEGNLYEYYVYGYKMI